MSAAYSQDNYVRLQPHLRYNMGNAAFERNEMFVKIAIGDLTSESQTPFIYSHELSLVI